MDCNLSPPIFGSQFLRIYRPRLNISNDVWLLQINIKLLFSSTSIVIIELNEYFAAISRCSSKTRNLNLKSYVRLH